MGTCDALHVNQLDGSIDAGRNCGCAVAAMAVEQATCNRARPTAAQVRTHVKNPDGSIYHGPLSINQIRDVVVGTYKQHVEVRYGMALSAFSATISSGRGGVIAIDYSPFVGTRFDCFRGQFGGDHFLWAADRNPDGTWKIADPGADGRAPGIPRGYQAIPDALIRRAAGLHKIRVNSGSGWFTTTVDRHYGPGHAFVLIGDVPEAPAPVPELPGEEETMLYLKEKVMVMAAGTPLYQRADLDAPILETVAGSFRVTTVGRPYRGNVVDTSWWMIQWTTNKPDNSPIATARGVYVRSDRLTD